MESNRKQTKRKGLTSLIALLLCAAMLIASTYAWFTDTATVSGNKINAGNLYVDVVATEQEIIDAYATEYGYKDFAELESTITTGATDEEKAAAEAAKKEIVGETYTPSTTPGTRTVAGGKLGAILALAINDESQSGNQVVIKTDDSGVKHKYYVVTDQTLPLIALSGVEPNSTWPVAVNVKNSGELAISYSAGFSIDVVDPDAETKVYKNYTGLQTLEQQHDAVPQLVNDVEYEARLKKLSVMQKDKNGADIGKTLEKVLEVYAMTEQQYKNSKGGPTGDSKIRSMELLKENVLADDGVTVEKKANYIGTIEQIITVNSAAAMKDKEDKLKAETDPTKKAALQAEFDELKAVSARLTAASSGYCITTDQLAERAEKAGTTGSTAAEKTNVDIYNELGTKTGTKTGVSELGTAYFAIHMPSEVDNLYQNASISLGVGVTATQVEYEFDGINYQIYDNSVARTPAPTATPTPSATPAPTTTP